jgi:hypothetical protein
LGADVKIITIHEGKHCISEEIPLELKQKYLGESRQFFLEPNRIRLITKNINGENEYYIGYESISTTTRTVTQQKGLLRVIGIMFVIFALTQLTLYFITKFSEYIAFAIILAGVSLVFFALNFYQIRRYILVDLDNKKSIFFIADKPSSEQLASFIKSLYQARKQYLRKKYYMINPSNSPQGELQKFQFLLNEEIISEAEFQAMKTALDSLLTNQAGFQSKGPVQ